jgi:transcriptional regulator with XRE-family HTH domain
MPTRRRMLAERRKAVGYSQEALAEAMDVAVSTVKRWESGATDPLPQLRPKLARLLRASLRELNELLAEGRQTAPTMPAAPATSASLAPVFGLPAAENDGARNGWGSVHGDVVTMQAFRTADLRIGGGHLYASVVNYLHRDLAPRLFGGTSPAGDRSVFTAAAALTEMAGWMAHDAGQDTIAQQHLGRAHDLVAIGGDYQLSAHILASMSHLSHRLKQPGQAIRLAHLGGKALHGFPPQPQLEARLLAMQARGHAARRQGKECTQLLIQAEDALACTPSEDQSPWISQFDEGSLASEAARCMRQLGDWSEARRQADRIIALRPSNRIRARAFGQLLLVISLIAQDQPEEACDVAHEALDATRSLGSRLVVEQLSELEQLFEPYRDNADVAEFLDSLKSTLGGRGNPPWLRLDAPRTGEDT